MAAQSSLQSHTAFINDIVYHFSRIDILEVELCSNAPISNTVTGTVSSISNTDFDIQHRHRHSRITMHKMYIQCPITSYGVATVCRRKVSGKWDIWILGENANWIRTLLSGPYPVQIWLGKCYFWKYYYFGAESVKWHPGSNGNAENMRIGKIDWFPSQR